MNNHLVGKTDIPQPRAKIGDVLLIKNSKEQWVITRALLNDEDYWIYVITNIVQYYTDRVFVRADNQIINNEDILKNLTTNVSYE